MLYIHHISCVSPQHTFSDTNLDALLPSGDNKLKAIEPSCEGIPPNVLRRMGKAVKMTVGAALPLLKENKPDGIILGTANGGMEDCIKFMNQIIQYQEGMLTPANFVQSTPNGPAAQLGLSQNNKGYNITHTHRGLSFENALIDAGMLLEEFPDRSYLVGSTDEISSYNYNVDFLDGWYKKETVSNADLYTVDSPASIAGEGAVMSLVSAKREGARACVKAVHTVHGEDLHTVIQELERFIKTHLGDQKPDILITGENGDNRFLPFYKEAETLLPDSTVIRFKHMSGEYPTASSFAFWLACHILGGGEPPAHSIKQRNSDTKVSNILIYNNYKGEQHSFIWLSAEN